MSKETPSANEQNQNRGQVTNTRLSFAQSMMMCCVRAFGFKKLLNFRDLCDDDAEERHAIGDT